jgi:NAD-dependent dihydropyrimidine dehydrogenase PreA subunit/nitroreductase
MKNFSVPGNPVSFKVDQARCLRCGMCVRDCAFKVLSADESNLPVLRQPEQCARCQHCFAVCPAGAITFDGVRAQDAVKVENPELPSPHAVENWMMTRRSVRRFADEDVDPAVLERLLKLLGNTPTGCNARALTFTCCPDRAAMAKFRSDFLQAIAEHRDGAKMLPRWLAVPAIKLRKGGEDIFFRGASGILIVSSDETAPMVTTPREDVAIACANFELLANAHGIATCWCGFLKLVQDEVPELLEKTLGLRRTTPFYAMLFGKSAVKYSRGVDRSNYANIVFKTASAH